VTRQGRKIIVYCAGDSLGSRAQALGQLGYSDVASMAGGFNKWKDEGRDWAPEDARRRSAQPVPAASASS